MSRAPFGRTWAVPLAAGVPMCSEPVLSSPPWLTALAEERIEEHERETRASQGFFDSSIIDWEAHNMAYDR